MRNGFLTRTLGVFVAVLLAQTSLAAGDCGCGAATTSGGCDACGVIIDACGCNACPPPKAGLFARMKAKRAAKKACKQQASCGCANSCPCGAVASCDGGVVNACGCGAAHHQDSHIIHDHAQPIEYGGPQLAPQPAIQGGFEAGGVIVGESSQFGSGVPSPTPAQLGPVPALPESSPPLPTPAPPMDADAPMADPEAPPAPADDTTETAIRGASFTRDDSGRAASGFRRGMAMFWAGRYAEAAQALESRAEYDMREPLAVYYLALALKRSGQTEQAEQALRDAVQSEEFYPIRDWGARMQRIQGADRLWLENARR